jgi:hypothetical protein
LVLTTLNDFEINVIGAVKTIQNTYTQKRNESIRLSYLAPLAASGMPFTLVSTTAKQIEGLK